MQLLPLSGKGHPSRVFGNGGFGQCRAAGYEGRQREEVSREYRLRNAARFEPFSLRANELIIVANGSSVRHDMGCIADLKVRAPVIIHPYIQFGHDGGQMK